jgi:diketogulonate reductase-like aldo/keto reductase
MIPNSLNSHRIHENFDLFDFELTDDEMFLINELNRNGSSDLRFYLRKEVYAHSPHYPFHDEF